MYLKNANIFYHHIRKVSTTFKCFNSSSIQVAVVGSGPAGFYTSQYLLKENNNINIDIYEKQLAPFGLVRYGVAPDHPEVKNVISTFNKVASNNRFRWIGNIEIGLHITLSDLRKAYDIIIFCYGCEKDKFFGIDGEHINGVYSARHFVEWYNGLPTTKLSPKLDSDHAIIIGQGNVAIDVARILLTPVDVLAKTDITEEALETLKSSKIKRIDLVGRRGPLQAAFTIAELREMTKLPGCNCIIEKEEVNHLNGILDTIPRSKKRMMKLLLDISNKKPILNNDKYFNIKFYRSPIKFNYITTNGKDKIESIDFTRNKLSDNAINAKVLSTNEQFNVPCKLAFRSIGYKGISIDSQLPFSNKLGLIPNEHGRIINDNGLYCSGWIKRGPNGVLATTMNDAFDTGKTIIDDIQSGLLTFNKKSTGFKDIKNILNCNQVKYITFDEWKKIEAIEIEAGLKKGKPREKFTKAEEFLKCL